MKNHTKKKRMSGKLAVGMAVLWSIMLSLTLFAGSADVVNVPVDTSKFTYNMDSAAKINISAEVTPTKTADTAVTVDGTTITAKVTSTASSSTTCGVTTVSYSPNKLTIRLSSGIKDGDTTIKYTLGGGFGSGEQEATLKADGTELVITLESGNSAETATKEGTITLTSVTLPEISKDINLTLKAVTVSEGGSYTASVNGTDVSSTIGGGEETYDEGSSIALTATVKRNYMFVGWYVNGVLKSTDTSLTLTGVEGTCEVEAKIQPDPLYSVTTLSEVDTGNESIDPSLTKDDMVTVNSAYFHHDGTTGSGSMYWLHNADKGHDGHDTIYFPDPVWQSDGTYSVSACSGVAEGDHNTSPGNSTATADAYSDIIQIYAYENLKITFDYSVTASIKGGTTQQAYLAYYISTSKSVGDSTVRGGTKIADGSSGTAEGTASITVPKGSYLYLAAYGIMRSQVFNMGGGAYHTASYQYTAKLSNMVLTVNSTTYTMNLGIRSNLADNSNSDYTKGLLTSGSVKVNGSAKSVNSTTANTSYTGKSGFTVTLTPGTAPSGYIFQYWLDATNGKRVYNATYSLTLDKDYEIYAVYVPVVTIASGGENGFGEATYTYKEHTGSGSTTKSVTKSTADMTLYVARNTNATAPTFYTSLAAAFAANDTVVLLAGDTFNGAYTIPSGKTLIIPCALDDTGVESNLQPNRTTSASGISYYVQATLNGSMTVSGNLIVNARQGVKSGGRAAGSVARLNLGSSASVTVADGGLLGAYGIVKSDVDLDSAQIVVQSGGTVYELIEILDIRPVATMLTLDNEKKNYSVLPFNSYHIRNVVGAVQYEKGSVLDAVFGIGLEGSSENSVGILHVISENTSNTMFTLSDGSLTKNYDPSIDRVTFRVDEGATVSTADFAIDLTYKPSVGGGVIQAQTITVNTADYYLPLHAGLGIRVDGDMTLNGRYKMLPGAVLDISDTGKATIADGATLVAYRLTDYDPRTSTASGAPDDEYWGYAYRGLIYNSANFSGITITRRTISTIGSAKVNVDGQLNVAGSFYVTHNVDDTGLRRAYFTNEDNGFDMLTGTGSINLTGADSAASSSIYEAMQVYGSRDPIFDIVELVPFKFLPTAADTDATARTTEEIVVEEVLDEETGEVTKVTAIVVTSEESDFVSLANNTIYHGAKKTVGGNEFYVWDTNRLRFWSDDELLYTALSSSGDTVVENGVILKADGTVAQTQTIADPAAEGKLFKGWDVEPNAISGTETADVLGNKFSDYDGTDGDGDADLYAVLNVIVATVGGTPADYPDLAEALKGDQPISVQMQASLTESESVNIACAVDLDLNGCSIPKVTLSKNAVINGFDTVTNRFLVADEDGKVPVPGTIGVALSGVYSPDEDHAQHGKHYVAIPVYGGVDGKTVVGTQFHRVAASITAVRFYLVDRESYLTAEAIFRGTPESLLALTDLGIAIDGINNMYVGTHELADGSTVTYQISDITDNESLAPGYTEPIHYTFQTDPVTNVQARMYFGTTGPDAIADESMAAYSSIDSVDLVKILTAAKENYDTTEQSAINAYIEKAIENGYKGDADE